jgi:cysteine synthase A
MDFETYKKFIPSMIENMPEEWLGTTFKNDPVSYVGRESFTAALNQIILKKNNSEPLTTCDLEAAGNAEDYLRVASNPATVLELALGLKFGYSIIEVYSFASTKMHIISVLFSTPREVRVFIYSNEPPFTEEQSNIMKNKFNFNFEMINGTPQPHPEGIVLQLSSPDRSVRYVDGYCHEGVLYINNPNKIDHTEILIRRKRMNKPETTPNSLNRLRILAGVPPSAPIVKCDPTPVCNHLKQLSGVLNVEQDHSRVLLSTTGLAALASFHTSLIGMGGADVVVASTGYGGSDKLASILEDRCVGFKKHSYDIQGQIDVSQSIISKLDELIAIKQSLNPTTVILIEIPTNPDMKVPRLPELVSHCQHYQTQTGNQLILLIDTTFCPNSQIIRQFQEIDASLSVMVFLSLSKSLSGGRTTGGALVANHTTLSQKILENAHNMAALFDTYAKCDQIKILDEKHSGVEERIEQAYVHAKDAIHLLEVEISKYTTAKMFIHFVTEEQAQRNIKPATFSFNLPVPKETHVDIELLPQQFVNILCKNKTFKPCVSFGQEVPLVYSTVPATSTQGDIKLEDKQKQAIGGIQLVRLSFPPFLDMNQVKIAFENAVRAHFQGK